MKKENAAQRISHNVLKVNGGDKVSARERFLRKCSRTPIAHRPAINPLRRKFRHSAAGWMRWCS